MGNCSPLSALSAYPPGLVLLNALICVTPRPITPSRNLRLSRVDTTIASLDVYKRQTLRLYLGSRKLWTPSASVVPARAAALMESWPLALEIYNGILKAEPENALALRGLSLSRIHI